MTVVILGGFFLIIKAGHFYCMLLVLAIIVAMFSEVMAIPIDPIKEATVPQSRLFSWLFFAIANFGFLNLFMSDQVEQLLVTQFDAGQNAWMIAISGYVLYATAVVAFVVTLNKECYEYQYRIFGWVHATLGCLTFQVPRRPFLGHYFLFDRAKTKAVSNTQGV